MIAMEDYFSQHDDGLLSDEQFSRGRETFRGVLKQPGLRPYWLKQRETMSKAAGEQFRRALKAFQVQHHLPADGMLGAATLSALLPFIPDATKLNSNMGGLNNR
jgi:murein L,D-transpeptidase YcbB/YkuD